MTVRISSSKVSTIMRRFFRGMPQVMIADKAGVDQGSVSHYSTKFKKLATTKGLAFAGKEFNVFNEVDNLRSLSVELFQARLTVEEGKRGISIIKAFSKLGVNPEQYTSLIELCKHVNNPDFITGAIKLMRIEHDTGMNFNQAISKLENAVHKLPEATKKLEESRDEMKSINDTLTRKNSDLKILEQNLKRKQDEVAKRISAMEQELLLKTQKLKVRQKEIEDVANLKIILKNNGLDIDALIKLGKEF